MFRSRDSYAVGCNEGKKSIITITHQYIPIIIIASPKGLWHSVIQPFCNSSTVSDMIWCFSVQCDTTFSCQVYQEQHRTTTKVQPPQSQGRARNTKAKSDDAFKSEKRPPGVFLLFAREMAELHKVPKGKPMLTQAGPLWNALSCEDKQPYREQKTRFLSLICLFLSLIAWLQIGGRMAREVWSKTWHGKSGAHVAIWWGSEASTVGHRNY